MNQPELTAAELLLEEAEQHLRSRAKARVKAFFTNMVALLVRPETEGPRHTADPIFAALNDAQRLLQDWLASTDDDVLRGQVEEVVRILDGVVEASPLTREVWERTHSTVRDALSTLRRVR